MEPPHVPVLLSEVISGLNLSPGQHAIDGTVGGGGHTLAILQATGPGGKLLAFDRDPAALEGARQQLKDYLPRLTFINDSYSKLSLYVERYGFPDVAGVLLDLGFSSAQLADKSRGFSFQISGLLDLRYQPAEGSSAAELLNTAPRATLEQIFREGGEPAWRRLAEAIVEERRAHPFATTTSLLDLVMKVKGRGHRSLHPATLVWQALRLAVNQELSELEEGLAAAVRVLSPGGRLVVISFHSGEDRVVKNFFRREARDCLCPPNVPICRCGHQRTLKLITRKPLVPNPVELARNPRARSAKLRIAERLI